MLGWVPLPPLRLVQPARLRRRREALPAQSISQSTPKITQPAEPAQPAPLPRYMQQRPRPLPPRNDPPMYRRPPVTESSSVRPSQVMSTQPDLAFAGTTIAMAIPYLHPTRWLAYLRAFIPIAIALLAVGYILYEALAVPD